jgi:hypothetical protein
MKRFLLSLDIGQMADYTAISVVENVYREKQKRALPGTVLWVEEDQTYAKEYHLLHLERLQQTYPQVIERTKQIMDNPKLQGETELVIDATGVGRPIVDYLRREKLKPIPITITAGFQTTNVDGEFHVPKTELVTALQIIFQSGRLKIAKDIDIAQLLVKELHNFRQKVSQRGRATFEAARESEHDDLVISLAMAIWYSERNYIREKARAIRNKTENDYDPLTWGLTR